LIIYAYGLRPHQRVDGFEALLDKRFAVVARVADGVTLAEGDERRLVRQLLAFFDQWPTLEAALRSDLGLRLPTSSSSTSNRPPRTEVRFSFTG
jgi:hypothetical protein